MINKKMACSIGKRDVHEFMRYFAVSVLALAVDYITYLFMVYGKLLDIPTAAMVGYSVGMLVSYTLITTRVFTNGWLRNNRIYEAMLFLISGMFGLGLTYLMARAVVITIGNEVQCAKIMSTAVSFIGVYFVRKKIVFKSSS